MRILFHHRTLGDGAEGIHIAEMVNAFRQLGHAVKLIGPEVDSNSDIREKGAGFLSWIKKNIKGPPYEVLELAYNLYGARSIQKEIKRFKPDFIYDRYITFNYSSIFLGKKYRVPVYLEVNSPLALERDKEKDESLFLKKIAYGIERHACINATKTIVVSTPLKEYLVSLGVLPEKIIVLPNGVNTDTFHPRPKSESLMKKYGFNDQNIIIGCVGILRPWHGIDLLLKAFRLLHEQFPHTKLLLIGDGPIRNVIEGEIRNLNLDHSVSITGRVPHEKVGELIALLDVAVSPKATFYASPMKILEYMAQRKAVVAPNMDNIKDIIRDRETGVLFNPESYESLYGTLKKVVTSKSFCTRISENAYEDICTQRQWKDNAERIIREHMNSLAMQS